VKPAALGEPGPSPDELRRLLTIASRVPDHGALVPWRFILFQGEARQAASAQLAAVYSAHHPERSTQTTGTLDKSVLANMKTLHHSGGWDQDSNPEDSDIQDDHHGRGA
jgi:nitroreductase